MCVPGVANMAALGSVVTWQKLDYDFEFHRQPFHTDIAVLVLSEGKSLLKVRFDYCIGVLTFISYGKYYLLLQTNFIAEGRRPWTPLLSFMRSLDTLRC